MSYRGRGGDGDPLSAAPHGIALRRVSVCPVCPAPPAWVKDTPTHAGGAGHTDIVVLGQGHTDTRLTPGSRTGAEKPLPRCTQARTSRPRCRSRNRSESPPPPTPAPTRPPSHAPSPRFPPPRRPGTAATTCPGRTALPTPAATPCPAPPPPASGPRVTAGLAAAMRGPSPPGPSRAPLRAPSARGLCRPGP